MSLFLGKIHYWLFNKIVWFEGLEKEIIKLAKEEGIDIEKEREVIVAKYGEETPDLPLEDMIDTSNIHGWLQGKIHSAEGRMAAWTRVLMKSSIDDIKEKIEKVYIGQGVKAGEEVKSERGNNLNATDIFNAMNDYILDGMPCDRVNEVVSSDENRVEWIRTICVHKDIWEEAGVSVSLFYELRDAWIISFVNSVNSNFEYVEEGNTKIIKAK